MTQSLGSAQVGGDSLVRGLRLALAGAVDAAAARPVLQGYQVCHLFGPRPYCHLASCMLAANLLNQSVVSRDPPLACVRTADLKIGWGI